jgi:small GTP-binding protein
MALFNYASKEITLKVVYYGPGLCGKTTNLQKLHVTMDQTKKGKLLSLSTDADRTLFFDFMPIQLGKIKDFNIRFQLYTVPGQVRYNATRKLVLKGADAIVFVADSQSVMKEQNLESFQNMKDNLSANNIDPEDIPIILQYNKRDLKKIMPVEEMDSDLNERSEEITEASAYEGWGVDETFKLVTRRLLKFISKKHNVKIDQEDVESPVEAAPAPVAPAPVVEEESMFDPDPEDADSGSVELDSFGSDPVQAGAKKSSSKDQIKISVKDKAAELLGDDSFLDDEGISSEWDDVLNDDITESDIADADITEPNLVQDEGSIAIDDAVSDVPEFLDNSDIDDLLDKEKASPDEGDSMLEQMLEQEDTATEEPSVADESFLEELSLPPSEVDTASVDASNTAIVTLTAMVNNLMDEVKETKAMQQEMLNTLKQMDKSLQPIYQLASKKKAPR